MTLTKKDTLVASLCVAFLIVTLGAAGGRRHSKALLCRVMLKGLGETAIMHANDNDGKFFGYANSLWMDQTLSYADNKEELILCPQASVPATSGISNATQAWTFSGISGSYALNGWLYDNSGNDNWYGSAIERCAGSDFDDICWPTLQGISTPINTPIFSDSIWVDAWPRHTDYITPEFDISNPRSTGGLGSDNPSRNHMNRLTVNRHLGRINVTFADGHVAPVELKELWSLTWHKDWNIQHDKTRTDGSPIYPEE